MTRSGSRRSTLGDDGADPGKTALMGALTLYLDFINLFVMLLQLTGDAA